MIYEIVVGGATAGRTLRTTFEDLVVSVRDGRIVLTGDLPDQPALHGVLMRVRDLGLELIEIRRLGPARPR